MQPQSHNLVLIDLRDTHRSSRLTSRVPGRLRSPYRPQDQLRKTPVGAVAHPEAYPSTRTVRELVDDQAGSGLFTHIDPDLRLLDYDAGLEELIWIRWVWQRIFVYVGVLFPQPGPCVLRVGDVLNHVAPVEVGLGYEVEGPEIDGVVDFLIHSPESDPHKTPTESI